MASFPAVPISNIFNTADYNTIIDGSLSLTEADSRYLKLTGGNVSFLTSPLITGTSRIEVQNTSNTQITSSSNCNDYGLHLHSVLSSSNGVYSGSSISFNNSLGENVPLSAIYLDKIGSGEGNLVFATRNGATCDERLRITDSDIIFQSRVITNRIGTNSISSLEIITDNSARITINNLGSIGINKSPNNSYRVDISGAINITGNWNSSGTTIIQSTNSLVNIFSVDFHAPSLLYKSIFRGSTIALSDGIEVYDTQFSTNNVPNINFRNDNNSSPVYMEMCGFLNNNRTTWTANGMPHRILYKDGSGFTSGLNITCMNTTSPTNTNANIVLSARNATIPHVVVNDQNNQLHLFPQNLVELNTSYAQNVIVGEEMLVRKTLCVGTSQDVAASRLISALNSGMATASAVYLCLGQNNTSNNQAEISFYYTGSGSSSNRLEFGFFGGSLMYLLANGRLGLGTSNPLAAFHCTTSVSTTFAISGVYGEYGSASSSSGNLGPITRNIAIRATDSFLTNGSYFAQSDRRVKKDIKPIELEEALDFINNVRPVKYRLRNEDETKHMHNGYIAQELRNHVDLLNFSECDYLPKQTEEDIENVMLSVDYAKVSVLLHRAILDLYDQIDKLKKKIKD